MKKEITPQEKARQLVNQYYGYDGINNQREAIEAVERVVLANFCQQTDSLHAKIMLNKDFNILLITSAINRLKWEQEIAHELGQMKNALQA